MLAQFQLARTTFYGEISKQACNNVFWHVCTDVAGASLSTLTHSLANLWAGVLKPILSDRYTLDRIKSQALAQFQIRTKGPSTAPEFKTVRKLWQEEYLLDVNLAGDDDSPGAPSFQAYSATKSVGQAYPVVATSGVVQGTQRPKIRSTSFRIGGVAEARTQTTDPNLIYATTLNALKPFGDRLQGFIAVANSGTFPIPVIADGGKQFDMYVLSEKDGSDWRIDKSGGTNPAVDWVPAFLASPVKGITWQNVISTQNSRKQKPGRLG